MYRKEPLKPWLGAVEAWGSAVCPLQNMELSSGTEESSIVYQIQFQSQKTRQDGRYSAYTPRA